MIGVTAKSPLEGSWEKIVCWCSLLGKTKKAFCSPALWWLQVHASVELLAAGSPAAQPTLGQPRARDGSGSLI